MHKASRERRRRRSRHPLSALRYQLDAARRQAHCEGIVVSDEDGLCLAASGETRACAEVAARLPLVARSLDYFEGQVHTNKAISAAGDDRGPWSVKMSRIAVDASELFVCTIGGAEVDDERLRRELYRTARGATRILAHSA
ncbi:MAG TPA: hypothetical protein VFG83_16930 [Kofleriaceae bacterium]|nr:hypothetical protein [Kofleriaceae bacterium]